MHGLSLVVARGAALHHGVQGSHCDGFFCCGAWVLEHRLSSCGRGLTCPAARGTFLNQRSNMCPLPWQNVNPWDSLGKNDDVGCHFLLQGIFLT